MVSGEMEHGCRHGETRHCSRLGGPRGTQHAHLNERFPGSRHGHRQPGTWCPPRSHIERIIHEGLIRRAELDTTISWIRGYIGIPGNVKADARALFESFRARISGITAIATEGGIRARFKAVSRDERTQRGYGVRRTEWGKRALSAYTWCRTDRGPQRSWMRTPQHAPGATPHRRQGAYRLRTLHVHHRCWEHKCRGKK